MVGGPPPDPPPCFAPLPCLELYSSLAPLSSIPRDTQALDGSQAMQELEGDDLMEVLEHVQIPLAPELGSCASPARAWRLWAARQ